MKKNIKLFVCLLMTMFVCIGCGKKSNSKNIADYVDKIYNNNIIVVNKAKSIQEVQAAFDKAESEVTKFIGDNVRNILSEDSVRITNSKQNFLKVCCQKAHEYDEYIDTEKGKFYIDANGNVCCGDDEPQGYYLGNAGFRFRAYEPIYNDNYIYTNESEGVELLGIKVCDANGEVEYSDEEAEMFYDCYVEDFLYAYIIALNGGSIRTYLKNNLYNIVCNLPLDDSYPITIRDFANQIYYNTKSKAENICLYKRGSGYVEYLYDTQKINGRNYNLCLRIFRDKKSGTMMVGSSAYLK